MKDEATAAQVQQALRLMEADKSFNTESTYSANGELHPDHKISFVEKHIAYLKSQAQLNPAQYLANLRLMIRNRS